MSTAKLQNSEQPDCRVSCRLYSLATAAEVIASTANEATGWEKAPRRSLRGPVHPARKKGEQGQTPGQPVQEPVPAVTPVHAIMSNQRVGWRLVATDFLSSDVIQIGR